MTSFSSEEYQFQEYIKRNLNTILAILLSIVLAVAIWEFNGYLEKQDLQKAQILFETYQETPNTSTYKQLIKDHPKAIHTQLVALLQARENFENNNLDECIVNLSHVITHAKDPIVSHVGHIRLASIYRHLNEMEKAQAVLNKIPKHDAYSYLQQALTLPNKSEERMHALNQALKAHPSPYLNHLIQTAQDANISLL